VLADQAAARYAAGTAYHCYEGEVTAQSLTHAQFPEKDIWETECSGGTWQKDRAFRLTAELVIGATRNWSRSVVLWGIALDPQGNPHAGGCGSCRGIITVDDREKPGTFHPTVDYYVLGQASRFVQPGAHRIASTDLQSQGLPNVAFQNADGSVALLVLNEGSSPACFQIIFEGRTADITLAANTMATFRWKPASSARAKRD
jgi:glucosylceramidase